MVRKRSAQLLALDRHWRINQQLKEAVSLKDESHFATCSVKNYIVPSQHPENARWGQQLFSIKFLQFMVTWLTGSTLLLPSSPVWVSWWSQIHIIFWLQSFYNTSNLFILPLISNINNLHFWLCSKNILNFFLIVFVLKCLSLNCLT